jgi:hypothetical protein
VGRHIFEIGQPVGIAGHAIPVIFDRQIMRAVLLAAGNRDGLGVRVDAVLDEFR